MIYSMTGYGKSTAEFGDKQITIELRSLNSKGAEISIRMPSAYKSKEIDIRKKVSSALERGKIDLSIFVENKADTPSSEIDVSTVQNYIKQLQQIAEVSADKLLPIAMKMPDVYQKQIREESSADEIETLQQTLDTAMQDIQKYRREEGAVLEKDLKYRVEKIREYLSQIGQYDTERQQHVRQKIDKALQDAEVTIDQNRLEQELIYYLEKLDITEEKVRLTTHLDYFIETMDSSPISKGKKLGFISQEMGREINTIGSKSNYASLQKIVVQMKDELEKIKEQTLNIL